MVKTLVGTIDPDEDPPPKTYQLVPRPARPEEVRRSMTGQAKALPVYNINPDDINKCIACIREDALPRVPVWDTCKQCQLVLCRAHYNKHMVYSHKWPK